MAASVEVTDASLESLRPALTGFCYRMLGASAEAEDAVQETLIRALRHRTRFDPRRFRQRQSHARAVPPG